MILNSVENGPLLWPTVEENNITREKNYEELSKKEKLQADCDLKATNIVLQDCDDFSLAKAILMANLLSCDSEVLSEVPHSDIYQNDMVNQSVQEMQYSKQSHIDDFPDNEITSDSNIIPYSQYLQETQNTVVQVTNSTTQQNYVIISIFEKMSNEATN
ncbi:hypothetical protein Tco_1473765 [Tanacetum coccineum]